MTPWVFGIGAGKTGTHSLAQALRIVGLESAHIGHETYHGRTWLQKSMLANNDASRPMLDGIEGYDALVDWPINEFWWRLLKQYPLSKFILTYRDPHTCALSWSRMVLAQRRCPANAPKTYIEYRQYCESHLSDVFHGFSECAEKLLILNMHDADEIKWRDLCRFIGVPEPTVPYPTEFTRDEVA